MTGDQDDHDRPDITDMRAALGTVRAILEGTNSETAHEAAAAGSCAECTAVAGISFMITAVSTMLGDTAFVSEGTRRVLLAAVEAAEREIEGGAN